LTPHGVQVPYTYQTSMGVEHQIGESVAVKADYVWIVGRHEERTQGNINLSYNPATGANFPFSDLSKLCRPGCRVATKHRRS
jgi:hypothetical protein